MLAGQSLKHCPGPGSQTIALPQVSPFLMFMFLLLLTSTHKQEHLWKGREGCHRPILEIISLCFLLWFNALCPPLLTTFLHLLLLSISMFPYVTVYFSSLVQQCWWLWQITNVCLVLGFSCSPCADAGVGAYHLSGVPLTISLLPHL